MAAITKLAIFKDSTGRAYGYATGQPLFTSSGTYLVSVIATNMSDTDGNIYVYTVPNGTSANPALWGQFAHNLPLPAYNTYETFRFAMSNNDVLYVAGSADIHYYVQGISQV